MKIKQLTSRKQAYRILTPLNPTLYIVKLEFTGVYIIFLISAQKHRLWVLVRTASSRRFLRVPTIYVLSRNIKKYQIFFIGNISFFGGKIFSIFEQTCFRSEVNILTFRLKRFDKLLPTYKISEILHPTSYLFSGTS